MSDRTMRRAKTPVMFFDRTVSEQLLDSLDTGPFSFLTEVARAEPAALDLQLRRRPGGECWASLYLGLTKLINVHERGGRLWLTAHSTHRSAGGFDEKWVAPTDAALWSDHAPAVEAYIDRLRLGAVGSRHTDSEGRVQTLISNFQSDEFGCFQREAAVSYSDQETKDSIIGSLHDSIEQSVRSWSSQPHWWPGVRDGGKFPRIGTECDLLALDRKGHLVAIEVKHAGDLKGITWAPAQVRLYTDLFAEWLDLDPLATQKIEQMWAQRQRLGLIGEIPDLPTQESIQVRPVVAIGDGSMSQHALSRLAEIQSAVSASTSRSSRIVSLDVWRCSSDGEIEIVDGLW